MVIYLTQPTLLPVLSHSGGQPETEDLFGLAPDGVYLAKSPYGNLRCALTAPFHPYPKTSSERSAFCCTFRSIAAPCC